MAGASDTSVAARGTDVNVFVRFGVLGQLLAESDRGALYVAGAHRRRLLALLVSRPGHVVPVGVIVDTIWGDDPPPSAATTVRSHVSRLRHSLRDGDATLVEAVPGGYRLAVDPSAIDAGRFTDLIDVGRGQRLAGDHAAAQVSLTAAIELWRGPAYLEFRDTDFGVAEGVRLDELYLASREDLADSQIAGGSAAPAVIGLERLVHDAPGRERAWQLLMRALYATGRQHDALNAFQRARRALADLGVEPSAALRETERQILEQHPAVAPASGQSMLAAALRTSTPLVGRTTERRLLFNSWMAAKSGRGQVRLLAGPLESGRTRLAADLAGRAIADGAAVEYARGDELLALFGQPERVGPPGSGAGHVIDQLAERCRWRPQLLIVDDAEYATGPTIDLITAIAAAADQLALHLLIVIDPSAGGPAVSACSRLDQGGAMAIEVEPMTDEELAAVLAADGVEPMAVPAIIAISDGLPGVARRGAAAWAERTASERLRVAATSSLGATAIAQRAQASVLDEVLELVDARNRRDELWSARWAGRQPYRALSSYGPQDAELFVGRERLVAELAARVLERRLVVVTGASGSGKSSLVRAGLVPLARSGRLPGTESWSTHVIVPGFDPLASLAAVDELDDPRSCLLVVDQFEETFAAPTSTTHRFAAQLVDLACDPDLDVHVVLVVRSEAYLRVAALPLGELAAEGPVLVGPPSDEEMRRIVVEPARRTGATVEPALVDLIAHDVDGFEAALPLVSSALAHLWERRDGGALRVDRYVELGGLANVVERLGSQALLEAGEDHEDQVRQILLMLADVTDDGVWTRRRVSVGDLPADQRALDALVDSRLVVIADDTVDIVHEVVFRAWPQLASWLAEARVDIVRERELAGAARTWDVDGRPEDHLWRGARLQAALEWADRLPNSAPQRVAEFLTAGRELNERQATEMRAQLAREQRSRRRATRLLGVAVVLLVLALVAGASAIVSRNGERDAATVAAASQKNAEHQALVSSSVALRGSDRQLAALLAIEAHRIAPSAATESALFGLFTAAPGIGPTTHTITDQVDSNAYLSDDGKFVMMADNQAGVRRLEVATGAVDIVLDGLPYAVGSVYMAPSADGRYLALATAGSSEDDDPHNSLLVWDLQSRQQRFSLASLPFRAGSAAMNADGSLVAVGGGVDGRIQIYDGANGSLVHDLPALPRPDDAEFSRNTAEVLFGPDGVLIVGSQAGPVRFFDAGAGTEVRRIDGAQETSEVDLQVSADGSSLLTTGAQGVMRYDLASGTPSWPSPTPVGCAGLDFAESIGAVVCGENDGQVVAIDLATGAVLGPRFDSQRGNSNVFVSRDGSTLLEFAYGIYTRWRLDGGGLVSRVLPVHGYLLDYTADGEALLVATDEPSIEVVDAETGEVVDEIAGAIDARTTADPNRLAIALDDGTLASYDRTTRARVGPDVVPDFEISDGLVTDESVLVWPFNGPLSAIDPTSGTIIPFGDRSTEVFRALSSGPGNLVTASAEGEIVRRDPSTGAIVATSSFPLPIYPNAAGGDVLIASSPDGQLVALDPDTLDVDGAFPNVRNTVDTASLSADGRRLIALGRDRELRLYDVASRSELAEPIDTGVGEGAALRPDGGEMAASTDHGVVIWDLDPARWVAAACELAGRNLTPEEWDRYLDGSGERLTTCPEFP